MYSILAPMCTKYGYHNVACGMIAQSIQEGWNSGLATKYHNDWGMKTGRGYTGNAIAMNNKAGTDPAVYRTFPNMEAGCEGYFIFLNYPRYAPLKSCQSDVSFLDKIGPCGWNSNPGYGKRCQSHLGEVYAALKQEPEAQWVVGRTYTTQQDLNVRKEPNGTLVPYDELTEDAKKHAIKGATAILKKGTRVTVKDIKNVGSCTWLKIPSGWICGKNSKNIFVS